MNLTEALNAALPELPVQKVKLKRVPMLEPTLIAREQIEGGEKMILVLVPETHDYYRVTPDQWALLRMFDGQRSYAEIAEEFTAQTNQLYTEEYVRDFAEQLQDSQFWHRTPQEKNIALMEKLLEDRRKRKAKKSKFGNLAEVRFSAWDPNRYLDWLYSKIPWVYSPWFIGFNLVLFTFTFFVFVANWDQIGRDTLLYYTFTEKGFGDIVEFWLLVCFLGFVHESAHGLTCKHTGGEVHQMGFLLIYLTPCFFCDVSEAWVYGSKWKRIATMASGIWVEMIICSIGTLVWWGTPPGTHAHDFAYKIVLITGVAVPLINLNPLIKLDGYFILTELLGILELKERSTALLSGWVRKNLWRLPVEVEYVPPRRRIFFVVYAILSGLYSYSLLFFIVRFGKNVFTRINPELAFIPATLLFLLLFKGRIRTLVRFMKTVYLDKKDRVRAWLTPPRQLALAGVGLALLFAPVFRDNVEGRSALEPDQRAIVRALAPGAVVQVFADEGDKVQAGAPLAILRNLALESNAAAARADYQVAAARATQAQLRYADYGTAEHDRQQLAVRSQLLSSREAELQVNAPISGTVVTPRLRDTVGTHLKEGGLIAEIGDMSVMKARLYVPETEVRKIHVGSHADMFVDALGKSYSGSVVTIAPAASDIEPGLSPKQEYKGIRPPQFYVATIAIPNPAGALKEGMSGTGKVFVTRKSLVGFGLEIVGNFLGRRVW